MANMASASSFKVPQVSQSDMIAFHEAHFSTFSIDHFEAHFLRPSNPAAHDSHQSATDDEKQQYDEEEEDDGLGYYPDGVKRTLTDEQIAIFRHSEIQALRRARDSQARNVTDQSTPSSSKLNDDGVAQSGSEDGEVSDPQPPTAAATKKSKKRKRGKAKNNTRRPGEEPIDLRKRTWDVVDKGLPTLDYGEQDDDPADDNKTTIQRRRISYDD
ncbi:hypothetical protein VTJ04DRAFT_3216 [Mycothermus thermophilus]|uniref:uncharacterized protein n=1 Tax=Humicola insolens TaxID=85995 RepID=UPI003743977B